MCMCKTSKVIGTPSNSISPSWISSTHEIGSTTTRKLDPENIGVPVGILSLCALELVICLGVILPPLPVAGKRRKNRCREKG